MCTDWGSGRTDPDLALQGPKPGALVALSELSLALPDELLEELAERVAAILADRENGDSDDGFMDVAGAAEYLACPPSRVYALVSAKRLPHHRDGSRLLFDRAELRAYVAAGGAKRP